MATGTERGPKVFKTKPIEDFEAAAASLGTSPQVLAQKLGYSDSAFARWKAKGLAPQVAVMAAAGAVELKACQAASQARLMLARLEGQRQIDALEAFGRALGITFVEI